MSGICKSIKYAYYWILRKERSGALTCPRDPSTQLRKFTFKQVNEIVNAFMPGGAGFWFWDGKMTKAWKEKLANDKLKEQEGR